MLTILLSLALSAAAMDSASDQAAGTSDAKPEKAKKICRSDGTTGSRLKSRICKTQEEWDAMNNARQDDIRSKTGGDSGQGS